MAGGKNEMPQKGAELASAASNFWTLWVVCQTVTIEVILEIGAVDKVAMLLIDIPLPN